jgi:DNA-binding XRE family transcriptional regulator
MMTSSQIRAARAFLEWSSDDLAGRVGLSRQTIFKLEHAAGVPPSRTQTLMKIKRVFEEAGVEFIGTPQNGAGVRFKPTEKGSQV